ncbi:class I SAM-dependent methyltransferase [Agromyces sp. NPDC056965]|uniref:class I SAM-dependent methyltransferase n=1 Tax=Agromyces sp. NPDC056965 TaxID=3345983 RepID=UPI0036412570
MTLLDDEPARRSTATAAPTWLSPVSYWQPAHIVTSAWLEHAPFAFWLVDVLRPVRIVELGTHYGFSFFVFSEAARRLEIDLEIYALDTWQGDDHAGHYGDDVFQSVRDVVEREYAATSHLMRGLFEDSRPFILDDSVDLLHIDGRHGYDDVKQDFEQWVDTVRDGGIVLFHDVAEHDRDFGVWRLWGELSSRYPSFEFTHGHGLGVLAVGTVRARSLTELFNADEATTALIRSDYEQLGARIARQARLEAMPAEIESLHDRVSALTSELARARSETDRRDEILAEYVHSTSWRITRPLRAVGRYLGRGPR